LIFICIAISFTLLQYDNNSTNKAIRINRAPSASKKAAVKKFLKEKGYGLKSGNSIKGISLTQTQNLFNRGNLTKVSGTDDIYKWKIGRTSPRILVEKTKDKKNIILATNNHGAYEKELTKISKSKKKK